MRARLRMLSVTVTTAVIAAASVPAATAVVASTSGTYWGAGTVSVIARSDSGHFVAGGDTQGLYRSTDGENWLLSNSGIIDTAHTKVAVVVSGGGTQWFAGVGNATASSVTNGTVLVSTNDGASWAPLVDSTGFSPAFQGANSGTGGGLPDSHPRSTGHLLRIATISGTRFLFAASFGQGLFRCQLTTAGTGCVGDWVRVGFGPSPAPENKPVFLRSIALGGAADNPTVFASIYRATASLARIPSAKTAVDATPQDLTTSPGNIEEIEVEEGIITAAGKGGLHTAAVSGGTTAIWSQVIPGVSPNRVYTAVAVRKISTDNIEVTTATCNAGSDCGGSSSANQVQRLTLSRSGQTITASGVTDLTKTRSAQYPSGETSWQEVGGNPPGTLITGSVWVGSDLLLDGTRVYAAGRGGIYRLETTSGTPGYNQWVPVNKGVAATFTRRVAVRGATAAAEQIAITDADWIQVNATTGFNVTNYRKDAALPNTNDGAGLDVTYARNNAGATTGDIVTTTGAQSSNADGNVNVLLAGGMTDNRGAPSGSRPVAVAARTGYRNTSGVTIAAVIEDSGLWFQPGASGASGGSWIAANTVGGPTFSGGNQRDIEIVWATAQPTTNGARDAVFVSVPGHGVYRYAWTNAAFDGGAWTKLVDTSPNNRRWSLAPTGTGSSFDLWTASPTAVQKIDNPITCTSSSTCPSALIAKPSGSGDIAGLAIAGDTARMVIMTTVSASAPDPKLFTKDLSTTGNWSGDQADTYYRSAGRFPSDIALSQDGTRAYVTTTGQGMVAISLLN